MYIFRFTKKPKEQPSTSGCISYGKEFSELKYLNRHKTICGNNIPCDKCTKTFKQTSSLVRHKNEQHNQCEICEKEFSRRESLNRHKM